MGYPHHYMSHLGSIHILNHEKLEAATSDAPQLTPTH